MVDTEQPTVDDLRIAANIRYLRVLARLTQDELAYLLGKYMHIKPTNSQVSFHETGRRHVNGVYLQAYAAIFKIPAMILYTRSHTDQDFLEAVSKWNTVPDNNQPELR